MKSIVIIPAFNEELSIGKVVSAVPKDLISEVVVVNNNSSDDTVNAARSAGSTVLNEIVQGYGASCLTGIDYVNKKKCDIVVFMDGDYSDFPEQTKLLVEPIIQDNYDFVLGSRILGNREKGALPIQSRIGSIISSFLIKLFWKVKYTDLGPFRAIKLDKLLELNMKDKAAKKKYKILEIPVSYRKRIGKSKVTGTLKGTFMASLIILKTIFMQLLKD